MSETQVDVLRGRVYGTERMGCSEWGWVATELGEVGGGVGGVVKQKRQKIRSRSYVYIQQKMEKSLFCFFFIFFIFFLLFSVFLILGTSFYILFLHQPFLHSTHCSSLFAFFFSQLSLFTVHRTNVGSIHDSFFYIFFFYLIQYVCIQYLIFIYFSSHHLFQVQLLVLFQ